MIIKTHVFGAMTALILCLAPAAMAEEVAKTQKVTLMQIAPAALRQDMLKGIYEAVSIPGQNQLWVASTPSFAKGEPGYVDILDATDLHPLRRIELPRQAFALAYDQTYGRVYVGNTMNGSLTVIDAASGLITDTIQLGRREGEGFEHVRMIEVDPATGRVVVTSPSDTGTVWIIDPANNNAITRIENSGLWTAGLAIDSKAGRAYTTGGGMNEILVLDLKTAARIGKFATGDSKAEGKEASQHFFVNAALDGENKRLFAADANSGALYVFDTATGKVIATVPTGRGTLDVNYSSREDLIFVTYRGDSQGKPEGSGGIVVLNGTDYARLADIPLPNHPNSLAFGDEGRTLYVTIKAPMEKEHPLYRNGSADSLLRIDLAMLKELLSSK